MTNTKYLQLPIPSKSDRGKIITECLDPAFTKIDQKIESMDENIDFNLLATLGIPYGGNLNNTNTKVAGTAYYDTANKKIYKCTANTSINYADSAYFEEISNNDLLGKLQNLINSSGDIQGKIIFRQYSWSSPAGSTAKITIPIGIPFKKILSYSVSSDNGKFPFNNVISGNNIVLGHDSGVDGYWNMPQNMGVGVVYLVLLQ